MSSDLFLIYGIAILLWLVVGVAGAIWRKSASIAFPILVLLGCVVLLGVSAFGSGGSASLSLPFHLADAGFDVTIDPLARWFLAIIAIVGGAVTLFAPGYLEHQRRRISVGLVWGGLSLLFASMAGVVLAANAITFLVAWEVMALSSFILVATDHKEKSIRRAAIVYLGATRIGTGFLMAGFLWAYTLTGTWSFSGWHLTGTSAAGPIFMILIGLATKAGCWPFHLWLPIAHPAAPAPVSAVMSGVMIKTAPYAMLRLFVIGHHLSTPGLGLVILTLGAISAFWGVIFALLQHDLKRLLAYSSVENSGIILMCVGVAIVGVDQHLPLIAQLGAAAALFHALNHAIFKSLLFLGAGAIDARTHLRNIEALGGLIRRMPWTGAMFIVGSAALCALPPFNGFASEWMLYRGLLGLATSGPDIGTRLGGLLLMGWLALIGALAVAVFVKAVGVVFLGLPRSSRAAGAKEVSHGMVRAQVFLAALCLLLGLAAPAVLGLVGSITAPLGPGSPATSWTIPYAWVALALTVSVALIGWYATTQSRKHPGRRFITWECGFGALNPRMQYTGASFAQPISRIFGSIYRYAIQITVRNRLPEHFPDEIAVETLHEAYLETRVYGPILKGFRRTAGGLIMRLQAGSVHQYLIYMALVLALLLFVGVFR